VNEFETTEKLPCLCTPLIKLYYYYYYYNILSDQLWMNHLLLKCGLEWDSSELLKAWTLY